MTNDRMFDCLFIFINTCSKFSMRFKDGGFISSVISHIIPDLRATHINYSIKIINRYICYAAPFSE